MDSCVYIKSLRGYNLLTTFGNAMSHCLNHIAYPPGKTQTGFIRRRRLFPKTSKGRAYRRIPHQDRCGENIVAKNNDPLKNTFRLSASLLILTILSITLYNATLLDLFNSAIHREGSSHGLFVPFISGYLIWLKFDALKSITPRTHWPFGAAMLLTGVLLFVFSQNTEYQLVFSSLSFLCVAGALVLLFFGKKIFIETAFPLFFLAAMIPIPQDIYAAIAERMRLITTQGSVIATKATGIPLHRDGFTIYLPETKLFVAESCSGIRYLLSFFVFSIIYAVLFKQKTAARLGIIAASIPLAVTAGVARLTTIFLAAHLISPKMAEHTPHIIISWAVFATFLFGGIVLDQLISSSRMVLKKDRASAQS